MKKILFKSILISTVLSLLFVNHAFAAGSWQKDRNGWWWLNEDGSWPAASWHWLDGNNDNVAECYYFDANGYLVTNTITADGYVVNADGAWTVDGVVQVKTSVEGIVFEETNTPASIEKHIIKTSQDDSFDYWLYTPQNATSDMPLIVYLHGHKENINVDISHDKGLPRYLRHNTVPAYVLMPRFINDGRPNKDWMECEASLLELIEDTVVKYNINRNKISITGMSMGGDGALALAAAHPELFSCVAPIAPFYTSKLGYDENWVDGLKQLPVWIYVEDKVIHQDRKAGKEIAKIAAEQINAAGGDVKVMIVKGVGHNEIANALFPSGKSDKEKMVDWLINN